MLGPVFLFQIFIIDPLPLPRDIQCIINNKLINNNSDFLFKINLIYKITDIC